MTKTEKILDIIMQYNCTHSDYEWWKSHDYVMRAIAANDLSVLSCYTQNQINAIRSIYNTWVQALELTERIDKEVKYNRTRRGY